MSTTSEDDDPEITVCSRQLIGENTVFSVFFDHIVDKAGNEVPRYLSVVPKHSVDNLVAGVAVLPILENSVGLIRIFRHPQSRWSWETPRGMVDAGEDYAIAALRELREETGFAVLQDQLVDLGFTASDPGVIKARIKLYSATLIEVAVGAMESELGHGEMSFFTRAEILDLINIGEIEDGCTLAILFKHFLKQSIIAETPWNSSR
jgi:ADP-ribose pyrophosphatase